MNAEPGTICWQLVKAMQAYAAVVPWLAPAIEATCRTLGCPPSSLTYQPVTRPPIEWLTMSTWPWPVRERTWSTKVPSPRALTMLSPAQL